MDLHALDARRKRLRFRCWHRGTREADMVFGPFADAHLGAFDEERLGRLERLLDAQDPDLYDWITLRRPAPQEHDHDVLRMLIEFAHKERA